MPIEATDKEFEMINEKFKPMSDSKHVLLNVWRIQNENLWSNYTM